MSNILKRIITSIVLISLIYLSIISSLFLFIFLFLITFLAFKEFNFIFKKIFIKNSFSVFVSNFLSVLYLSLFAVIIWINLTSFSIDRITSLIFILLICVMSDIGGFIFGKLIGGKKLTRISPNKTYSGVIGSFLFSFIFAYLFYYFQKNFLIFEINIFLLITLVSLSSQIGDLTISFFKRKANMKDTGYILPGHGGILDRIDGILIAIPFGTMLILL